MLGVQTGTHDRRALLTLDAAGREVKIARHRTVAFEILVVARAEDNESAGYMIRGVVEDNTPPGGKVDFGFVDIPSITGLGEDEETWGVSMDIDDDGALHIWAISGLYGSSIRWVATMRTSEVAW